MKFGHLNVLGRFLFELADDLADVAMRPLRDHGASDAFELSWVN